ncbi:MAG: RluA family pseudouridine synthase [Acidobacteria bacterium]|nr:RluA family pseudouridine synthase [Acidobacteriota bacterium]
MTQTEIENKEDNSLVFSPGADAAGVRLDAYLAARIEGWSRARLQRLITDGDVLVNGKAVKPSYKLHEGEEIDVDLVEAPAAVFEPEDIPLDIVFEDEYLAVINKPAGMVVHPGAGNATGTLANAIAWHLNLQRPAREQGRIELLGSDALNDVRASATNDRVGIVHRLDKDTSGLIVVAKEEETHEALSNQFRDRLVAKQYVTLVHGSPRENMGTIDRPMARDRWHRTKMTVAANGRNALTMWKVRQRFEKFTLLEVEIKTGRTHQIRVHLASINHPVVGDPTYNEGRDNTVNDVDIKNAIRTPGRFFLHAERLLFTHPKTGEPMSFHCEIPQELAELLESL